MSPLVMRKEGGSLLFDMELEGFDGFLREQRDAASALEKLVQLLHALHPSGSPSMQQYAARLSRDAAAALKVAAPPGEPLDLRLFLEVLTCCGHEGWLRTGKAPDAADGAGGAGGSPRRSFPGSTSSIGRLSGGGANPLLSAPRHTFVVVRAPAMPASEGAAGDGCMLVVDPHFKQQFPSASIAASSPVYASLVEALPELVIGTAEGMGPLIKFLCEQMDASFAENGIPLPPWRDASYMLSMWFPEAAHDVPVFRPTVCLPKEDSSTDEFDSCTSNVITPAGFDVV